MAELLKIIGSSLITAFATILGLYLKRKWEVKDRDDTDKRTIEEKIDSLAEGQAQLEENFSILSAEFAKETTETESETRGLRAGVREMLYDRIKHLGRKYIEANQIREEDFNSLTRMWNVYHDELGGNGYLNDLMVKIKELPKY